MANWNRPSEALAIACIACAACVFQPGNAFGLPIVSGDQVTIDFNDGHPSGSTDFTSLYTPLGISFPEWRYHDSTLPGNVAFPFADSWGIVLNPGLAFPEPGFIAGTFTFASPITSVSVDVGIQLTTVTNEWRLIAFDSSGTELGSIASVTGPTPTALATSTLFIGGVGEISKIMLATNRKLGVDTIRVTGLDSPPSPPVQVPDRDDDGIPDDEDICPDTVIPEAVPTVQLGVNRFALTNADGIFDTVAPTGKGPQQTFTIADTAGCSCEQIIAMLGLGKGHTKFGCSIGAMKRWIEMVNP